MKLTILFDHRFFRNNEGRIFSAQNYNYNLFANRYLEVFEEVDIVARVSESNVPWIVDRYTEGPSVHVVSLGNWQGLAQYIQRRSQIRNAVNKAVSAPTAIIMIAPGTVGSTVFSRLVRQGRPYGVEVVTDPYDMFAPGSVKHPLRPFLRRWSAYTLRRQCAGAYAASYVTSQALQRRYPPNPNAFATGCSDVNLSDEAFVVGPREFNAVPDPIQLVLVGTLEQMYKAPDVLIDAVGRCVERGLNIRLTLVGDGKFRASLEAKVASMGLSGRIKFTGRLSAGAAVLAQLDQADLFVLPSRQEGLPRALVEAMARGLPCVASTVGGVPELLPPEDLVPAGDAQALADKIIEVVTNPARMTMMSKRNLEVSRAFHGEKLQACRIEFYRYVRDKTEEWLREKQR